MLICPVCRSQNMDTAKFCGNCGNPFPRPAAPTSSLINCAQGHVYSAVYEYCPYCPQPESRDSDFITRVEEPITAVDPAPYTHSQSPNDFATRIDSNETLFETAESPSVRPPAAAPPAPAPEFIPTELVTNTSPPRRGWSGGLRVVQTGGRARASDLEPGGLAFSTAGAADAAIDLVGFGSPHHGDGRPILAVAQIQRADRGLAGHLQPQYRR